jgi:hypothetical protein
VPVSFPGTEEKETGVDAGSLIMELAAYFWGRKENVTKTRGPNFSGGINNGKCKFAGTISQAVSS